MNIDDMSIEQLIKLNEYVCHRITVLRAQRDFESAVRLHQGQQVRFNSRDGEVVFGRVIKINRKTVIIVAEDDRRQWKVPVRLVVPVKDVG